MMLRIAREYFQGLIWCPVWLVPWHQHSADGGLRHRASVAFWYTCLLNFGHGASCAHACRVKRPKCWHRAAWTRTSVYP